MNKIELEDPTLKNKRADIIEKYEDEVDRVQRASY